MPYSGGTYSLPAGTVAVSNATANSTHVNSRFSDLESAQNAVRPVVAGGTGVSSLSAFVSLLDDIKGVVGAGVGDMTAAIQAAIDAAFAAGGGTVYLEEGTYNVSASSLFETYDNSGVSVSSSEMAIVLRKGVSLVGKGKERTIISVDDPTIAIIGMIAPEYCTIQGMTIKNTYDPGDSGAGSGIFVFGTAAGADIASSNNHIRDVRVFGVAGYGIGLQNGYPTNWTIENIEIEKIGADGLDLKSRDASGFEPVGNVARDIRVKNHGLRIGGSGVDVRGAWHLSNIVVTDFPGVASQDYWGIRFRTLETAPAFTETAERSTLTGFLVDVGATKNGDEYTGLSLGSPRCFVSNGTIRDADIGVIITGNATGTPDFCVVQGVSSEGAATYGFDIGASITGTRIIACETSGSTTGGFWNKGIATQLIGCHASEATKITTSTTARLTQVEIGGLTAAAVLAGNNFPEGSVTAGVGAIYRRLDGGAGTTLYVKESGTGNTGWVAK